ncbi:MAG: nucleotidyltransferase [Lachnospiraceae bacterium]|nr:nucleotidyltransferase [Lachnospiraceae bacterium]
MKTTLVIMAAGIGSRFGQGIKQLAQMGKNGEIIMDYSVHDAREAGFDKVVFIIRKDIEKEFNEIIGDRISKEIETECVFQEMDALPEGFTVPEGRKKPWGTGQAVLACKGTVKEPFVIINADDYYGKNGFRILHDFLVKNADEKSDKIRLAMAAFVLKNTLSENGAVTRGVCKEENGRLTDIVETTGIFQGGDGAVHCDIPEVEEWISPDSLVSMNMWAGYPDFLDTLEEGFKEFLSNTEDDPLKKEYLLPMYIGELMEQGRLTVDVLRTEDKWIGITYHEDLAPAQEKFREMIENGYYPEKLYS